MCGSYRWYRVIDVQYVHGRCSSQLSGARRLSRSSLTLIAVAAAKSAAVICSIYNIANNSAAPQLQDPARIRRAARARRRPPAARAWAMRTTQCGRLGNTARATVLWRLSLSRFRYALVLAEPEHRLDLRAERACCQSAGRVSRCGYRPVGAIRAVLRRIPIPQIPMLT